MVAASRISWAWWVEAVMIQNRYHGSPEEPKVEEGADTEYRLLRCGNERVQAANGQRILAIKLK